MNKFAILSILWMYSTGYAQPVNTVFDTTKPTILDNVVVTGQYGPQSLNKSVFQVRVIPKEKIQKIGAVKLQDVLNYEMNIRFSQDLATGGSNITMMGLGGQNVKILIDGMPMTGKQGTNNSIDLNQIDVQSIERIEIVEGPMSVVYGADALAGVINIITRKSTKSKWSLRALVHEETVGKEYGIDQGIHNQSVGAGWQHNQWDAGVGFSHNYFGGWQDTAVGRELVWHKKDQLLLNGYLGFRSKDFSIRYRFDGLDEVITNPGNYAQYQPQTGDTVALDQEYLAQRLMHQLQAAYTFSQKVNLQWQSAYTDYSRQVFSTTVSQKTGEVRLNTAPGSQGTVDFNGFTQRLMLNYRPNKTIAFQPGVDINLESGEGERMKDGKNTINDYAAFASAEITPGNKWNIRPGVRFIYNSVYEAPPLIPSLNAKYKLNDQSDIKFAYARGFRSPSLRELYMNFFDASHQIIGNPDLEAETSHSLTASITNRWISKEKIAFAATLNTFYNLVKNRIDYGVSPTDPNITTLINVAENQSAGANLNMEAKGKSWQATLGGGYTGFYNDYSGTDDDAPVLQWSPELVMTAGYNFKSIGLDVNVFYKFTGKRPYYTLQGQEAVLSSVDPYHIADLTLNKKLGKMLLLNMGIRNLFNESTVNSTVNQSGGAHATSGARYVGTGRGFFAGLQFNLDK